MHIILNLWKQHSGKGIYQYAKLDDAIRCIEIAINSLPNKEILIVVNGYDYYTLRKYFPNHVVQVSQLVTFNLTSKSYFAVFTVGIDRYSEFYFKQVASIKRKYELHFTTNVGAIPSVISNDCTVLESKVISHVEYNYIVPMSGDTSDILTRIEDRMSELMGTFRNYDNITGCIAGANGLSALDFRNKFAADNGWRKDLNINIQMFANIDKFYNPDNLFEQAAFYNKLVRERETIINKADDKIRHVVQVALMNHYRKIVILVKGDDVCERIAKDINSISHNPPVRAEAIHANTPNRPLKDETGEYISYKSGKRKGEIKEFGTKSVNDAIIADFNKGKVKVIVTTGTLDKRCHIEGIELIITMSPKGNNYFKVKSRLSGFNFNGNTNIVNIAFDNDRDIGVIKHLQGALNIDVNDILTLDDLVF